MTIERKRFTGPNPPKDKSLLPDEADVEVGEWCKEWSQDQKKYVASKLMFRLENPFVIEIQSETLPVSGH